jgi:hypothetical protein
MVEQQVPKARAIALVARAAAPPVLALMLVAAGGAPPSLTGTYSWGTWERGSGTLLVIDEGGGARFQLLLDRGAPTHNQGVLEGRLTVKDGRATYESREERFRCRIEFAFARGTAVVRQAPGVDADCGFGYAVTVDGTYKRTSRKKPTFQPPL